MTWFLRHLELHLTAAGLLVIGGAALVAMQQTADPWRVVALVATTVGVLHGGLFWVVRRRQRRIREQTIDSVRRMLKDVVNNHLMVIQLAADTNERHPGTVAHSTIDRSVRSISSAIASLSSESLREWAEPADAVSRAR